MVTSVYDGLGANEGFELFERRSLAHVGIAAHEHPDISQALDETARAFDDIAESVSGHADWRHLQGEIQDRAWAASNPKGRMVLAVGGLARRSWRFSRERTPRDALFPRFYVSGGKITHHDSLSAGHNLAMPLIAVNREHVELEYIPESMLDVCHAIYHRERLPDMREQILGSMDKMHFTNTGDADEDFHRIERFFKVPFDDSFLRKMVDLAISDAERGDPDTFQYRSSLLLQNTLVRYPSHFTEEEAARIMAMLSSSKYTGTNYPQDLSALKHARQLDGLRREAEDAEQRKEAKAKRQEALNIMGEKLTEAMRL